MKLSDAFEARFTEMLGHYPTKRSVLVPTLLYMQDELGYLTDEAIREIAQRLELTELEVRNVISYYYMLTTKPRGKYNVQVCRNTLRHAGHRRHAVRPLLDVEPDHVPHGQRRAPGRPRRAPPARRHGGL